MLHFRFEAASFDLGDGLDEVDNSAVDSATTTDVIKFGADITAAQVIVNRAENDLVLYVGDYDRIIVKNHFAADSVSQIDQINFSDGLIWSTAILATLIIPTVASDRSDVIAGTNGTDVVYASFGNDDLRPSAGNDYLDGGYGSDNYHLTTNSGMDVIVELAVDGQSVNTLNLGPGITRENISIGRSWSSISGDVNLSIGYNPQPGQNIINSVDIHGFFEGDDYSDSIDIVRFSDGSTLTAQDIWSSNGIPTGELVLPGNTAFGGMTSDFIEGDGFQNYLYGLAGNDTIWGGVGDDLIWSHSGDDTLNGGIGNDKLDGGAGVNVYEFSRGDGVDTIAARRAWTDGGTEVVRFGSGISSSDISVRWDDSFDTYWQEQSASTNNGISVRRIRLDVNSAGGQVLLSSQYLEIASQTELLVEFADGTVWQADDLLAKLEFTGTAGSDVIVGTANADRINGVQGDDFLQGEAGNDTYTFVAGDGIDIVSDTEGADTVYFGAGITASQLFLSEQAAGPLEIFYSSFDRVSIQRTVNGTRAIENIKFADGTIWSPTDITDHVSKEAGTPFSDVINGTDTVDLLNGLAGDDEIVALGGNDTLTGGADRDRLNGGTGADTYIFAPGSGRDSVTDSRDGVADDNIIRIQSLLPAQIIVSRDQSDLYIGVTGTNDWIALRDWMRSPVLPTDLNYQAYRVQFDDGTLWNSTALLSRLNTSVLSTSDDVWYGSSGNDAADGLAGSDVLSGAAGNDRISGAGGNDTLDGGVGNDLLFGGSGDDHLWSDEGVDLLDGGDGLDESSLYSTGILIGGTGNDFADVGDFSGVGMKVLGLFNSGDGDDEIHLDVGTNSTFVLSLGGIGASEVALSSSSTGGGFPTIGFGTKGSVALNIVGPLPTTILQTVALNSIQT